MVEKQRTITQNKALHLYFTMLADELNNAGLDMRVVLKPSIDISWTPENIKEYIWRPIQNAQLGKKSTTQMTTKDIDAIYDTITRHLGEKFGIFVQFPSEDKFTLETQDAQTQADQMKKYNY